MAPQTTLDWKTRFLDPISKDFCIDVYRIMLKNRLADEKMKKLIRQNKGGAFHLSTQGHELIGAVCGLRLKPGFDYGLPYYRDRAFALGLGCNLIDLFANSMAREAEHHSRGRMMPEHFSQNSLNIPCQSSVVGSQYLHAVGIAKGIQLFKTDQIVYVSSGDGATSQGDFHEALNFSSIHNLSVIFCIQDNSWAISVPQKEQTAGGDPAILVKNFPGVEVTSFDGTDFESTIQAVDNAYLRARQKRGASVLVAKVPRIDAHSSSDDPSKYQSKEYIQDLKNLDPVDRMEKYLMLNFFLSIEDLNKIRTQIFQEVETAAQLAEEVPHPKAESVLDHVFCPVDIDEVNSVNSVDKEPVVMVDALNHALIEAMEENDKVVVFGQDVAHGKGGVFSVTKSLTEKFSDRCFNTPLAESTIMGLALGLAISGWRPVAEIQFADYIWTGINQLFNEISTYCYRSGGQWNLPCVIRMPIGGYIQGGPYHSQSIEAFLAHCPGLKIVYPSNAHDAKGLLKAAIKDPNPVIFLEHKGLYRQRTFSARIEPDENCIIPLGKGNIVKEGTMVTIVTWGMITVMAHEVCCQLEKEGYSIECIDIRTISPLDENLIFESVKKTGKLVIAQEAPKTCGFAAEILSRVVEKCFEYLDAPIVRICGLDAPIAYSKILEEANLPQKKDIYEALKKILTY